MPNLSNLFKNASFIKYLKNLKIWIKILLKINMDDRDQNIAPGPSQKVHTHTHNTEPIKLSLVVNKKDNGASRHEEKSQGGWWKVFA